MTRSLHLALAALAFASLTATSDALAAPDSASAETPDGVVQSRAVGPKQDGARSGGKKRKGPKLVGPFKKSKYPFSEARRPLTLPKGMLEIGAVATYAATDPGALNIAPTLSIGATDRLEFGLSTGFGVVPDAAWNDSLGVSIHALFLDTKNVDLAPGVLVPLTFGDNVNLIQSAVVEARGRINLPGNRRIFITFGQGALPLGFGDNFSATLVANAGLGFQLDKSTVIFGDVQLVTLGIAPEVAVSGIWEDVDFAIGGQITPVRGIDIGLRVDLGDVTGNPLTLNNPLETDLDGTVAISAYVRGRL